MSGGRTKRITRTFVMIALAVAFPVVTMGSAVAQCYPPPCGGGGGGGTATTVRPPTTVVATTTTAPRASTTTTTVKGATTTTTAVVPIAPAPPEKMVKDPEKAVKGGGLLSRTGSSTIIPLTGLALVLTAVGFALVGAARRRTATAAGTQLPG